MYPSETQLWHTTEEGGSASVPVPQYVPDLLPDDFLGKWSRQYFLRDGLVEFKGRHYRPLIDPRYKPTIYKKQADEKVSQEVKSYRARVKEEKSDVMAQVTEAELDGAHHMGGRYVAKRRPHLFFDGSTSSWLAQ